MATAINILFFLLPKPVIIQAGVNTIFFNLSNEGLIIFETCSYTDFTKYVSESDLIITHGGVGALRESILLDFYPAVFVRKGAQKEHVDDHQVDWCNLIFSKGLAQECADTEDLKNYLSIGRFRQSNISLGVDFFSCKELRDDLYRYIFSTLNKNNC